MHHVDQTTEQMVRSISRLEASGAIAAENTVLRVIADEVGLPGSAGGCFVSGGSAGNLSALAVARETTKARRGDRAAGRQLRVVVGTDAHSSIVNTLRLLEMGALVVKTPDHWLTADAALLSKRTQTSAMLPLLSAPRERRMPASSTIWPELQRSRSSAVGGFMSTVRTADPESLPHRYATSTPASSKPTRSSSTHTSGFSLPLTAVRSSIASPNSPGQLTPRTPPIWT